MAYSYGNIQNQLGELVQVAWTFGISICGSLAQFEFGKKEQSCAAKCSNVSLMKADSNTPAWGLRTMYRQPPHPQPRNI